MRRANVDHRGFAKIEQFLDRGVRRNTLVQGRVLFPPRRIGVTKARERRVGLRIENREMTTADVATPYNRKSNRIHSFPLRSRDHSIAAPRTPHLAPRTKSYTPS